MRFEWDERKNKTNFAKHDVWFEEAQTVWSDAHAEEYVDEGHTQDETRYIPRRL